MTQAHPGNCIRNYSLAGNIFFFVKAFCLANEILQLKSIFNYVFLVSQTRSLLFHNAAMQLLESLPG